MQQVIVPSIGTSGSFIFLEPFNKEEYNNLELTVESVRSLVELSRSGIDPFTTIYEPYLLTETDFQDDLDNNIPILVLRTLDNNLLYVPADRVSKLPDTTGVRYQERVIAINLGAIPYSMDLETLKEALNETTFSLTGIQVASKDIRSSAIVLVDSVQDETFTRLLEGRKRENKSYRIKYEELLVRFNKLQTQYNELCECIKNNLPDVPVDNR